MAAKELRMNFSYRTLLLSFLGLGLLSSCKLLKMKDGSSSLAGDGYPACSSSSVDPDRDGWGWENNQTCRVVPLCSSSAADPDGDGWGWENKKSCKVAPTCQRSDSDPDGDGWGWENTQSCRVAGAQTRSQPQGGDMGSGPSVQLYETTYYPYRDEHYYRTACGDANNYSGMYFAVTENSPLWKESCDNESWTLCQDGDCLGKWDRMPPDLKKWENGQRMVREPRCNIPCGKRFRISTPDKRYQTTAVIYDACPSQHWNNRFKEATEGKNPCARGALHVDLRKPLYLYLNGGQENDNIKVMIDSQAVN